MYNTYKGRVAGIAYVNKYCDKILCGVITYPNGGRPCLQSLWGVCVHVSAFNI